MTGPFFVRRLCTALLLVSLFATASPQLLDNPWLEAIANRDLAALSRQLDNGRVNPNQAAQDGRTALMIAAQKADAELAARLVAAGANVNATNVNGGSVLAG